MGPCELHAWETCDFTNIPHIKTFVGNPTHSNFLSHFRKLKPLNLLIKNFYCLSEMCTQHKTPTYLMD